MQQYFSRFCFGPFFSIQSSFGRLYFWDRFRLSDVKRVVTGPDNPLVFSLYFFFPVRNKTLNFLAQSITHDWFIYPAFVHTNTILFLLSRSLLFSPSSILMLLSFSPATLIHYKANVKKMRKKYNTQVMRMFFGWDQLRMFYGGCFSRKVKWWRCLVFVSFYLWVRFGIKVLFCFIFEHGLKKGNACVEIYLFGKV